MAIPASRRPTLEKPIVTPFDVTVAHARLRWFGFLGLLVVLAFVVRLLIAPDFIETRDGLFFSRALTNYNVAQLRPHWPGYPVYIWCATFINLFVPQAIVALHLVSITASALTLVPIALLTRDWRRMSGATAAEAGVAGLVAAVVWMMLPISWLNGTEIFSDPLALLLGLILLWLCQRAIEARAYWAAGAAFIGGTMLGVRLSYVALLLPLAYIVYHKWRDGLTLRRVVLQAVAMGGSFIVAVGLWLGWQLAVGGVAFIEAGTHHLSGHYSEWGGSITTDQHILTRPLRFVETALVYELGGWWPTTPLARLPATVLLLGCCAVGAWRLSATTRKLPLVLAVMWTAPYVVWILLGNDVDLARYGTPLAALICILVGLGLPRRRNRAGIVAVTLILSLAGVCLPLAQEHHTNRPIALKLTHYIATHLDPHTATVIVSDDAPTLIFFVQNDTSNVQSLRVLSQDMVQETARLKATGRDLYIVALPHWSDPSWYPVVALCRGRYMESRGPEELWLYHYGDAPTAPVPTCVAGN